MMSGTQFLFLAILSVLPPHQGGRLNIFVRHFEPVSYDTADVHMSHLRRKRSISDDTVAVQLRSHNRDFHLRLKPDTSMFHKDIVVETTQHGVIEPELDHIYTGHVVGDDNSHVYGALHDGEFEGGIETTNGTYYLESARKYFQHPTPFHSIMYDTRDVELPHATRTRTGSWCGLNSKTKKWMEDVYRSMEPSPRVSTKGHHKAKHSHTWIGRRLHASDLASSEEEKRNDKTPRNNDEYSDQERGNVTGRGSSASRRVCTLEVNVDHLLFQKYSEAGGDKKQIRARLSAAIASHIVRVNKIYRATDFNGIEDVNFAVLKIYINDSSNCIGPNAATNPFCAGPMEVTDFLNIQSSKNHDEFCLSYAWTYRDFADGVLGLAWISQSPSVDVLGQTGGVCQKYKSSLDPKTKEFVSLGLNTGIITFINFNTFVPSYVSEITQSHEIGHNFGSPHDTGDKCAPGVDKGGNYIMYPYATKGNLEHNDKFSPCSIGNMSGVLIPMLKGDSNRENCFQDYSGEICGNDITEGKEECDCGLDASECTDQCCYPRHNDAHKKGCTLRPNKECSPTAGPCCAADCKLQPHTLACEIERDCTQQAFCDGKAAKCPEPVKKPDNSACNNKTQVCKAGECSGSICEKYGLNGCYLPKAGYTIDEQCLVACIDPNDPKAKCKMACDFPKAKDLCGLKMMPGSPCLDLAGYCDVFQKCRGIDAEGPLLKLHRMIFGGESVGKVKNFIQNNVALSIIILLAVVVFLILMIRFCTLHTPSSHPQMEHEIKMEKMRSKYGLTTVH
ncbi:disintegrin and metalloproteinase domain-containing protein 10-like isoform X2 [Ornithodoros turicata]|uniref:disintegrin and metalloproteinase domain-containing protein 10-like isoform X2 n=1 Tax=Ornithodoros turicata TaxID=34597 RepID=UPI003139E36B